MPEGPGAGGPGAGKLWEGNEGAGVQVSWAPEALALFHQQHLVTCFAPGRVEEPEQHPEQAQDCAHQRQLQPFEDGVGLPLLGLPCCLL